MLDFFFSFYYAFKIFLFQFHFMYGRKSVLHDILFLFQIISLKGKNSNLTLHDYHRHCIWFGRSPIIKIGNKRLEPRSFNLPIKSLSCYLYKYLLCHDGCYNLVRLNLFYKSNDRSPIPSCMERMKKKLLCCKMSLRKLVILSAICRPPYKTMVAPNIYITTCYDHNFVRICPDTNQGSLSFHV